MNARDQDPAQWPSVATATRVSNLFRYRHLPYLFSLHFRASLHGGTVLRPLFFEFPADPNTHTLSFQFMWGPALLVVPVISPGVDSVRGYLPPGELWYSMSEAHLYGWAVAPGYSTFNAPRDTPLPVFIRGGHIIPRQVPALTTAATRQNPFQLLIALKPTPQNANESTASGELFWDDGETPFDDGNVHPFYQFQFFAESSPQETRVHINCTHGSSQERLPIIDQLELFGHQANPLLDTVKVNGAKRAMDMTKSFYDAKRHLLVLQEAEGHSHPLDCRNGPWTVSWQNEHNETSSGGQAPLPNGPLLLLLSLPALATILLGLVWPSF